MELLQRKTGGGCPGTFSGIPVQYRTSNVVLAYLRNVKIVSAGMSTLPTSGQFFLTNLPPKTGLLQRLFLGQPDAELQAAPGPS